MRKALTWLLLFCSSLLTTSRAADTIAANQNISSGETIVSGDGTYEMGFYSPQNSTLCYFAIWYYKIPTDRVVWVANRDTPVPDSTGYLNLDEKGILTLYHNNTIIWSTNQSRQGGNNNPVAQLLDSGNLVVRNENENRPAQYLWQSFNEPGNAFLPGMKIGRTASGLFLYSSSWKSVDDPAQGNFKVQVDPSGLQLMITKHSVVTARSGPWNGLGFGVPNLIPNKLFRYDFVYNDYERYFTYELINTSVITKLVLKPEGVWERKTWAAKTNSWVVYSTSPQDVCDTYNLCGAYATCTVGNLPLCGCLSGFVPKYQYSWEMADWTGGCLRRTVLGCLNGDGFVKLSNIKLPDMKNFSRNVSMTLEECRTECLKNCSCTAYSNSDVRGSGRGCLLWFSDLVDIKQYKVDGQDLYIRVAASDIGDNVKTDTKSNVKKRMIIILGSILGGLFLSIPLVWYAWRKRQRKDETYVFQKRSSNKKYQNEDLELSMFSFTAMANATNNFSDANKLGEGGFGPVYKGILKDGREIAVKRLSKNSRQGHEEFKNEVMHIGKLQHRNLVKLLGYSIRGEEKMLIYEFMLNKSLDFSIFDPTQSMLLDWPKRYIIIHGIARGLIYLHEDSRLKVIHRDLKASNILLDEAMNPKISDFGLARSFEGSETEAKTRHVMGTYGYLSPEYAIDGLYSVKSDVFSFGVLVLEIVSGNKNRGFCHEDHDLNLLGHAWKLFMEGRAVELVDTSMAGSYNLPEVLHSIHVGLLCVQRYPIDRPSMSSVILMLSSEGALPEPKQPGFFTGRDTAEISSAAKQDQPCCTNECTASLMMAR